MIHQPYGQVSGQISDIEIQAAGDHGQQARHQRDPGQALPASRIERVAKDTERDRYLTAMQAKEYGLVDEVVGHIPESARRPALALALAPPP